MMVIGKRRVKSHMTMEYDFTGIRILGAGLIPVDWHISVDLVAIDKNNKSPEDAEFKATVSYQRLFFWMDTNLPNTVMVDASDEDDLFIANLSSNIMFYCPNSPYDDTIAELLHSKLSAIADGNLYVGEIRIKASDMAIRYSFDGGTDGYSLPSTTAEYYTDSAVRDTLPWWRRNDGFSFEFAIPDDPTIDKEELFKGIMDPLDEFDRLVRETEENDGTFKEPARIVQVERWKPKKV